MTHYKSHKVAYFCRQWRANDCVLERGSVLTATTAECVTKTKCLHSHDHVLGSPSAPQLMQLTQASKHHRFLSMRIFSHRSAPHACSLKRKRFNMSAVEAKSKRAGRIPICFGRPAALSWDPRRCVNVCVARRGEGVNCSYAP